jgi:hypothetical protein
MKFNKYNSKCLDTALEAVFATANDTQNPKLRKNLDELLWVCHFMTKEGHDEVMEIYRAKAGNSPIPEIAKGVLDIWKNHGKGEWIRERVINWTSERK